MRTLSSAPFHKPGAGANDSSYIYPTISHIRKVHDIVLREYLVGQVVRHKYLVSILSYQSKYFKYEP